MRSYFEIDNDGKIYIYETALEARCYNPIRITRQTHNIRVYIFPSRSVDRLLTLIRQC